MNSFTTRLQQLESLFGNPLAIDNPCSFKQILVADEQEKMLADGEQILDVFGLNREFIPHRLGGNLTRVDQLIQIMRAVFRRDPALGLGYGASSLIAGVNVWCSGTDEQQRAVADLLIANKKVACSYYELDHGNDLTHVDFSALPSGDSILLSGSKQVTTNLERAQAVVFFARTSLAPGSRSHSQVLLLKEGLKAPAINYLPRFRSTGMKGVQLGGIMVENLLLPKECILGTPGRALETSIKSFQVTRTAIPSMFLGILDSSLRLTYRHTTTRNLYKKSVLDLPFVRAQLVATFIDILLCDVFATTTARLLSLTPREISLYPPSVKYLTPGIMLKAMDRLSSLLGASFYLRDGTMNMFQKFHRDLKPVGFGHVARVACQMTILPQLPRLAKKSWFHGEPAPRETFQLDTDIPDLTFETLSLGGVGHDRLVASFLATVDAIKSTSVATTIIPLITPFFKALQDIQTTCAQLSPGELTAKASVTSYKLAARYTVILAASCALNFWWGARQQQSFLADPTWLIAVLARLTIELGCPPKALPVHVEVVLFNELKRRCAENLTLDLYATNLNPWTET